jgi:hypothetical protein
MKIPVSIISGIVAGISAGLITSCNEPEAENKPEKAVHQLNHAVPIDTIYSKYDSIGMHAPPSPRTERRGISCFTCGMG